MEKKVQVKKKHTEKKTVTEKKEHLEKKEQPNEKKTTLICHGVSLVLHVCNWDSTKE
jgi:hypothetical protein